MRRKSWSLTSIGAVTVLGMVQAGPLALTVPANAASIRGHRCSVPFVRRGLVTVTCAFTGEERIWKAPSAVTSATFDLYGAQGGSQADTVHSAGGGFGAHVHATLSVQPGQFFAIYVGGTPALGRRERRIQWWRICHWVFRCERWRRRWWGERHPNRPGIRNRGSAAGRGRWGWQWREWVRDRLPGRRNMGCRWHGWRQWATGCHGLQGRLA